jgi:hypothetical protein
MNRKLVDAMALVGVLVMAAVVALGGCADGELTDVPLAAIPNSVQDPRFRGVQRDLAGNVVSPTPSPTPTTTATPTPTPTTDTGTVTNPPAPFQVTKTCTGTRCTGQVTSNGTFTASCSNGGTPSFICCDGTISCAGQSQGACSGNGGICASLP